MKENKVQYVKRERDLMSNLDHPFFVKLYFTFQDDEKLCILSNNCQDIICFNFSVEWFVVCFLKKEVFLTVL